MTEKKNPITTPDYLMACKMQREGMLCPALEEIKRDIQKKEESK